MRAEQIPALEERIRVEPCPPEERMPTRAERIPAPARFHPDARRGTPRSKSLRERRGCRFGKVACRRCGRRPPQRYRCVWRSSYEPPVRGHRHYRQIARVKTWAQWSDGRSAGQNELSITLAVIALLWLIGLLCCVVLVVFLFRGSGLGRGNVALDLPRQRFHLVNDPDILVVVHDPGLRMLIGTLDRGRTQADAGQVGGLHAGDRQAHRQRKECHAKRHGEERLADRDPDRLEISEKRGLHALQPRNLRLVDARIYPQALGVNARCGCQNCCDQVGWRLHLRETLQPAAARLSIGEQRAARCATLRVRLESAEFDSAQGTIDGVRKQKIEFVTPHSVTGLVWHHITCL